MQREKGVSPVISNILLLLVVLMVFVAGLNMIYPKIIPQKSQISSSSLFSASYSFSNGNLIINIKNTGGTSLSTNSHSLDIVMQGNGVSYLVSHLLSSIVSSPSVPVNGTITYNSNMDGITIPASQQSGLTIIVSIIDSNANKVIWDAQFQTAKYSSLQIASFSPVNVTVGAPVGLGAVVSGGVPPYHYSWSSSPSTGYFTAQGQPTTEFYPSAPGTYVITVVVTDSFSATSTQNIRYYNTSNSYIGPASVSGSVTINVASENISSSISSVNPFVLINNLSFSPNSLIGGQGQGTVTFTETGLPSGTQWTVNLNGVGQQSSTTTIITFKNVNFGTYSYSVGQVGNYKPNPATGSVTVSLLDPNPSVSITFSLSQSSYTVTFTESGLPSGTSWSVTLGGVPQSSTTNAITFTEPNGQYQFSVSPVSGYTASPSSGTITVNGQNVNQPITFSSSSSTYTVTFSESGLPSGTSWSVTFNGNTESSTTTSIVFSGVSPGNYYFSVGPVSGYTASPSSGSLSISSDYTEYITFSPSSSTYTVNFYESGLPLNAVWSITFNGQTQYGSGDPGVITFTNVPSGSYTFTVGPPSGYTASPSQGTISVPNTLNIYITFTQQVTTYTVTFTESGLPSGYYWSVTFGGNTQGSTSTSIVFSGIAPGSYSYSVSANGYTANPSSGTIYVSGNVNQQISFTNSQFQFTLTFTESGLPSGTLWQVSVAPQFGSYTTYYSYTDTISITLNSGIYLYSIPSVTVGSTVYSPQPSSGSVYMNSAQTIPVTFTAQQAQVVLQESGLPAGASWVFTFDGSQYTVYGNQFTLTVAQGSTHSLTVSNTVYNGITYAPSPSSGTYTITYSPYYIYITFTPYINLIFQESGLPTGATWSMNANGVYGSSSSSQITFSVPQNSYVSYSVNNVVYNGITYTPSPQSGTVYASTNNQVVYITFTPTYTIIFTESGLPNGVSWWVNFNGMNSSALAPNSISFQAPAYATYPYFVDTGIWYNGIYYLATPSSGSVYLSQNNQQVQITYNAYYMINVTSCRLPSGSSWSFSILQTGQTATGTSPTLSVLVPAVSSSYTIQVHIGTYPYSIFLPVNASKQYGGVYILSFQANATSSYDLSVQASVSSSGGFTVCFRGYYQVITVNATAVLPLYSSTNLVALYGSSYYYSNNSALSNNIIYNGSSNFKGWKVVNLLPWGGLGGMMQDNTTTPSRLIMLSSAIEVIGIGPSYRTSTASGSVEYGYPSSYPTLYAGSNSYSQYKWVIGNSITLKTPSPYYKFNPTSVQAVSKITVNVYGITGTSQDLLCIINLTVYPILSLSLSTTSQSSVLPGYVFTVSFTQPLPSSATVVLDLSGFGAGSLSLSQMPGSGGYTYTGFSYLPYVLGSQGSGSSGYVQVKIIVAVSGSTYTFVQNVFYTMQ
jgi:hypothetical protein